MNLNKLRFNLTRIGIFLTRKKTLAGCGHKTRQKDTLTAFRKTIILEILPDEDALPSYCHQCLEK